MVDSKKQKELAKLVSFCRKNGVTSLKIADFQVDLSPNALFPESDYKKKKSQLAAISESSLTEQPYDDEAALFWSSAGVPESAEGAH